MDPGIKVLLKALGVIGGIVALVYIEAHRKKKQYREGNNHRKREKGG